MLSKDTRGAKVTDAVALSAETAGKFLQFLKSAFSSAIQSVALPMENISALEFTGQTDLYDSYLKSTAGISGINSRLIYASDKQNLLETQLSIDVDANAIKDVYFQFENFLNYYVNQMTGKYKFLFHFEGIETSSDRSARLEKAQGLASLGIVLPQKFSSALGMLPQTFERQLAEARASGFVDSLTPIIQSAQLSGSVAKTGGRPKESDDELTESGANTRSQGNNLEKKVK